MTHLTPSRRHLEDGRLKAPTADIADPEIHVGNVTRLPRGFLFRPSHKRLDLIPGQTRRGRGRE